MSGLIQILLIPITKINLFIKVHIPSKMGAQWLSGRVLDSRPKGRGFEPHRRHCVVFLSKNIYPSLVLVQPRKTRAFITERLLMGRKESNQTNKQTIKDSVHTTSSSIYMCLKKSIFSSCKTIKGLF